MVYFLKINVAIALFYAFYRLFFYKDTFFAWRRTSLLCFFAVSAAVPLLNIQHWIVQQEPMAAMADLYAAVVLPELTLTLTPQAAASSHTCLMVPFTVPPDTMSYPHKQAARTTSRAAWL